MPDRVEDAIKLGPCEELQVRVGIAGAPPARARRVLDRVARRPALLDREPEDRVQEGHHVANRLRRRASGQHRSREPFDVLGRHRIDNRLALVRDARLAVRRQPPRGGCPWLRGDPQGRGTQVFEDCARSPARHTASSARGARYGSLRRVVLRVFKSSHGVMKMGLGVLAL
jgi:hypothetical protein